jgi:hypothetical protein
MATKNTIHHSTPTQTTTSSPAPAVTAQPAPAVQPPSPSPPPDPNGALLAYVQQTIATLDAAETGLGADPPLTPKDKRHAAKLRKGGDKAVAQIANLATQNQLDSVALSVAVMTALMGKADALQQLANRLDGFVKHVGDLVFSAQSTAWGMAMQYYALLQRRAATDAELAKALSPVVAFFAYRHPSTKAPVGSPTKRQRQAVTKATRTLKTVAGGKLANGLPGATSGPANPQPGAAAPSPAPSPSASPTPAPAGNGAPPNGAAAPTAPNGGGSPAAHS